MIIRECIICGKPIKVFPCQEKEKKCCSRACLGKWRSQNFSGKNHPQYKGGTVIYRASTGQYYRYRRGTFSQSTKNPEHRYIMEQVLGRKLEAWEEVHHINGDTLNNHPSNLYVLDRKNHSRLHSQMFNKVQRLERENQLLREELALLTSPS